MGFEELYDEEYLGETYDRIWAENPESDAYSEEDKQKVIKYMLSLDRDFWDKNTR